ncbi:MAG: hypothetical protein US81_C0023G0010 [Parcubacteria group bacterium GW2011_GWE2_38_18]|nr:MAG: hypothetical protein US81_C0023G0010 [Parcubacteria group bacterium GW2011_GWE2_38_18]
MKIQTKKRNHYIPKTYLEKFLNEEDNLFVYKKGEKFFNNTTPKERLLIVNGKNGLDAVGVKNNLYIPEGEFKDSKNIFEDFFCEELESPYSEFINYVEANFFNVQKILSKYHIYIINLISSMMVRTLHYKSEIENISKVFFQHNQIINYKSNKHHIDELRSIVKNEFPELNISRINEIVEDYLEMINKGEFEVEFPRNLFIKQMMMSMEVHYNLLSNMTIQFLRNDAQSFFITSDNPAVYFVPKGKENFYYGSKSLGGPYTELYFPLSKNLCLLLTRRKIKVLSGIPLDHTNKKIIRGINTTIAHNSKDFIYSPYSAAFLDKFIKEKILYPFKFSIK